MQRGIYCKESVGPPRKESSRRLGFMAGEIKVPEDFDSMGDSEIEKMFGEDE